MSFESGRAKLGRAARAELITAEVASAGLVRLAGGEEEEGREVAASVALVET